MIKILWADDQESVIKAFAPLLSPIKAKITSVKTGGEAFKRLQSDYYDLLILDLKMPPGKWGGLWLLEEIKKFHYRVPVIVISGEGTQTETIKALRLGASDYVTKDKVEEELLDRIHTLIENTIRVADKSALSSFPTPIALAYKRYLNSISPADQLRKLIEFYDASLKLCSIIGICELNYFTTDLVFTPDIVSSLLSKPSMGTWNKLRNIIAKKLLENSCFYYLNRIFDNKKINALIEARNNMAHGAGPSEKAAENQVLLWIPELKRFIKQFWQTINFQILIPSNLHFDGKYFTVTGNEIKGDSVSLPLFSFNTSEAVVCDKVYLYSRGSKIELVCLHPFVIGEPAMEPNNWRVFIYDTLKKFRGKTHLIGDEQILYTDLWSCMRNEFPACAPKSCELPDYLNNSLRALRAGVS